MNEDHGPTIHSVSLVLFCYASTIIYFISVRIDFSGLFFIPINFLATEFLKIAPNSRADNITVRERDTHAWMHAHTLVHACIHTYTHTYVRMHTYQVTSKICCTSTASPPPCLYQFIACSYYANFQTFLWSDVTNVLKNMVISSGDIEQELIVRSSVEWCIVGYE